jgi:phosphate uptake regulator
MYELADDLDESFESALKKLADQIAPGNSLSGRELLRMFRVHVERVFDRWENVSDRCVDAE